MLTEDRARLVLSLVVEPGDPQLVELSAEYEPTELVEQIRLGRGAVRPSWHAKAPVLDALADDAMRRAEATGLRWVARNSTQWPRQLDDLDHVEQIAGCTGAPLGLWVRGAADLRTVLRRAVAVVGARACTTYGAEVAGDVAADCASVGVTVVSGAAFGIDACAHRGALMVGAPTVAVLACGADVDYPRPHAALLSRIVEDGLVISEYPPGEPARKQRFLARNRIIAGLSEGLVVVEAAQRSGSLNTLNWADHLGRTTMAVPGPVTSQSSAGAHAAIRGGKAILVTQGSDVVGELAGTPVQPDAGPGAAAKLAFDELQTRYRSVTEIASALRMGVREVSRGLAELGARGLAESSDGLWRRR